MSIISSIAGAPLTNGLRTVLFDLDGTLADTAPDLAFALNTLLQQEGRPALPLARIRPIVSQGARALIRLGFAIGAADPSFEPLRLRLLAIYSHHLSCETRLFPGMADLLEAIEQRGMNWGVVTNKPAWLTNPLIEQLGLAQRALCVVSGDTTANPKPHPGCMLHACALAGSKAHQCLFIGDAQGDIEAGSRAGMRTLVALFGYISPLDRPETWGADGMINHPLEALNWIEGSKKIAERACSKF